MSHLLEISKTILKETFESTVLIKVTQSDKCRSEPIFLMQLIFIVSEILFLFHLHTQIQTVSCKICRKFEKQSSYFKILKIIIKNTL